MQLSDTSIKLLENELGYSYFMWETACDEAWDPSDRPLSKKKEFEISQFKKKFDDWVQLVHDLGLLVEFDEDTSAMCGQATFHVVTKEYVDTLQQIGLKVVVI